MNRISAAGMVAIVLWGATAFAPSTHAQGAAGTSVQTTPATLDDAGLEAMLAGLGYEPKKLSKGFLITSKKDTWTFYIQFVLSGDKSRLGMNANLGVVENPDSVTAPQWMTLMVKNGDIDPSCFYFDKDQKKLYIHRVLENRDLTPAYVRTQIENFTSDIFSTKDAWNFTK